MANLLSASVINILNPLGAESIPNPITCPDVACLIEKVINLISMTAFLIAPVIIIIAAYYFIISGGNPEKIRKAKSLITYTIIGLLVILFSRAFVALIQGIF
jgi:hypothetical protein